MKKLTKIEAYALISMILLILYLLFGLKNSMIDDPIFGILAISNIIFMILGIKEKEKNKK